MQRGTAGAHRSDRHVTHTEQLRQIRALYGDDEGWCCVGHIDGDPLRKDRVPLKVVWEKYAPARAAEIAWKMVELGERVGNLYLGLCLFSAPRRSYENAQPSPWLWNDDLREIPPEACMVVESSAGNHQVYVRLDCRLPPRPRSDLQGRMQAMYRSGSASSDAVKLVRAVAGYNRKGERWFPVRLVRLDDRTFPVTELEARWPRVVAEQRARSESQAVPVDWAEVGRWQATIDQWCRRVDGRRIPQRVKPGRQTWLVLTGQFEQLAKAMPRYIFKDDGSPDWSHLRCVVAHGMRIVGYPDVVIAAFLMEECDYGRSERGMRWLERDIEQVIAHARKEYPQQKERLPDLRPPERERAEREHIVATSSPTSPAKEVRAGAPVVTPITHPEEVKAPRRPGRQRVIEPEAVLAHYRANAIGALHEHLRKREEDAAVLGISVPTLDRIDRRLRERGAITIRTAGNRAFSVVTVLDMSQPETSAGAMVTSNTPPSTGTLCPANEPATSEVLSERASSEVLSEPAPRTEVLSPFHAAPVADSSSVEQVLSELPGNATTPEQGITPEELDVPEHVFLRGIVIAPEQQEGQRAACEVMAAHDPAPDSRLLPPAPSPQTLTELVDEALDAYAGAVRYEPVLAYVRGNGGDARWSDAAIERAYRARLKYRKQLRDTARRRGRIAVLGWKELDRMSRSVSRYAAELQARRVPAWVWWMKYAGEIEAELSRRRERRRP